MTWQTIASQTMTGQTSTYKPMTSRKYSAALFAIALLSLAVASGCSGVSSSKSSGGGSQSTSTTPASISATAGATQTAAEGAAFSAPFTVTVLDSGSTPVVGASVVFTAPSSGASGTFANSSATETDKTNSNGVATSSTFTANSKTGSYTVTAAVTGVSKAADFALTNTAPQPASISASAGATQNATEGAAFSTPLSATVLDAHSHPVAGASVIFTAPSSGASGTFANSSATETDTTNSSGIATSSTFTANATAGSYAVTASVSGVATPADFALTNNSVPTSFAFYLYGYESIDEGYNPLTLAGSVTIDASGTVLSGEQDYNDAYQITSPEPGGDAITGGTLSVDPTTGQGTLTLITNNSAVGVDGIEILGVQFVNAKHARVLTLDGTATSSGGMDAQTLPSTLSGGFAFALAGTDVSFDSYSLGGVFTVSGTSISNGAYDSDDDGTTYSQQPFTATISAPDSYGRGTITGAFGMSLVYYTVGPEVIRMIDVDVNDSMIGSAYGQGASAGTFGNSSLGSAVFGMTSNSFGTPFAYAGQLTTNGSDFSGYLDYDNEGYTNQDSLTSEPYSVDSNGRGTLTFETGDINTVVIYMTDPTLNLLDPNNTTSGLGGGLILDLSAYLTGIGFVTPQTDTSTADFTGNYAFGLQGFYGSQGSSPDAEGDYIGQGSVSSLALDGSGILTEYNEGSGVSGWEFSTTFSADGSNAGRYTPGTLVLQPPAGYGSSANTTVAAYQASGTQLYWVDKDTTGMGFGFLEQQGSLTGVPGLSHRQVQSTPQHKKPSIVH
jgi:hypothetical protein